MPQILQINYKFTVSRAEFESGFDAIAAEIAKVPGLRWKIWLLNEAESRAEVEVVRVVSVGHDRVIAALEAQPGLGSDGEADARIQGRVQGRRQRDGVHELAQQRRG